MSARPPQSKDGSELRRVDTGGIRQSVKVPEQDGPVGFPSIPVISVPFELGQRGVDDSDAVPGGSVNVVVLPPRVVMTHSESEGRARGVTVV